jgi:hypothetical protein
MRPRDLSILGALALALACGDRPDDAPPRAADTADAADAAAAAAPPAASASWSVALRAAGPVSYGATLAEARRATGDPLAGAAEGEGCAYVAPGDAPPGMRFMVENGRIVRVDVDSAGVATDRGAEVGMREADVRRLHRDSVAVRPHKYVEGARYLIVVPRAAADSSRRIVFETDASGRVVRYRAGVLPAVEYVEGCG